MHYGNEKIKIKVNPPGLNNRGNLAGSGGRGADGSGHQPSPRLWLAK